MNPPGRTLRAPGRFAIASFSRARRSFAPVGPRHLRLVHTQSRLVAILLRRGPRRSRLGPGVPVCFNRGRLSASESKPDENEIDSNWDDEEEDLDSGWDDEAISAQADSGAPRRVLTAEEHEARAARAAARKDRRRAKAGEKSERRKARAAAASAKQKKQAKRSEARPAPTPRATAERRAPRQAEAGTAVETEARADATPGARTSTAKVRRRAVPLAVIVVLLLVVAAGALGLFIARR